MRGVDHIALLDQIEKMLDRGYRFLAISIVRDLICIFLNLRLKRLLARCHTARDAIIAHLIGNSSGTTAGLTFP